MNEEREAGTQERYSELKFGARFAPRRAERQVGETGVHPATPGRGNYPPQAVENRKIIGVSV